MQGGVLSLRHPDVRHAAHAFRPAGSDGPGARRTLMEPKVHPSLIERFANARAFAVRLESLGCGSSGEEAACEPLALAMETEGGFGGAFGVRRPLRFLTYKLGLNETQVTGLARILDELKTERAQAAVDDRRTLAAFADALTGAACDAASAAAGGERRVD